MTRFPQFVEWEITDACDLACRHCHRRDQAPAREMTDERKLRLADRLADAGVRSLTLSGGEPTLCGALWPVVRRLKAAGVFVSLISNGRDDSADFAARCADGGLDFVQLSLDGLLPTHDFLRSRDGAFARLMRTTANLAAQEVPFGFMTTLVRPNVTELDGLSQIVKDSGARLWQLNLGLPNGHADDLWLRPGDLSALRQALPLLQAPERLAPVQLILGESLAMALQEPAYRFVGQREVPQGSLDDGCPAGRQVLAISCDGRLRGCSCLPAAPSDPLLDDTGDLGAAAAGCRSLSTGWAHGLKEILMQEGWPVDGGFCHALAQRCAPEAQRCAPEARRCGPSVAEPRLADPATPFRNTRTGGSVVLCSALLAGLISCGPAKNSADEKTTPPDASKPTATMQAQTPPPAEPMVESDGKGSEDPAVTTDATPAEAGPSHDTTNIGAPSAMKSGMKAEPWVMPRCCMSHMLVPDCKCSPPDPNANP